MTDFLKYYNLENYLFHEVSQRFRKDGIISSQDLFLILVWKANRAKTKARDRLKEKAGNFSAAAKQIGQELYNRRNDEEKLKTLILDWNFRLPTATAILTVLYPDDFTVYDVRVREELRLSPPTEPVTERTWSKCWGQYLSYKQAVIDNTPRELCLRDKDRYLWARSFIKQIQEDLAK